MKGDADDKRRAAGRPGDHPRQLAVAAVQPLVVPARAAARAVRAHRPRGRAGVRPAGRPAEPRRGPRPVAERGADHARGVPQEHLHGRLHRPQPRAHRRGAVRQRHDGEDAAPARVGLQVALRRPRGRAGRRGRSRPGHLRDRLPAGAGGDLVRRGHRPSPAGHDHRHPLLRGVRRRRIRRAARRAGRGVVPAGGGRRRRRPRRPDVLARQRPPARRTVRVPVDPHRRPRAGHGTRRAGSVRGGHGRAALGASRGGVRRRGHRRPRGVAARRRRHLA